MIMMMYRFDGLTPFPISKVVSEMMETSEKKRYMLTDKCNFKSVDKGRPKGYIFKPRYSDSTYLISREEIFKIDGDLYRPYLSLPLSQPKLIRPYLLSNTAFCYVYTQDRIKVILFKQPKPTLAQPNPNLINGEVRILRHNLWDVASLANGEFALFVVNDNVESFAHAGNLSLVVVELKSVFSRSGTAKEEVKFLPIDLALAVPDPDDRQFVIEVTHYQMAYDTILLTTRQHPYLFLCLSINLFPSNTIFLTIILAYKFDYNSKDIEFIGKYDRKDCFNKGVKDANSLMKLSGVAFSRRNMPYLLLQPMSPVFSLTLLI